MTPERKPHIALRAATAILMLLPLLSACVKPSDNYSEYHTFSPDEGWIYGDTVTFTPEHFNSLCRGNIVVAVRHTDDYPYTELWLELLTYSADLTMRRDTLHFSLTDRHGAWAGHGIGASFQTTDTAGIIEHPTGIPVKVRHIMRTDTLRGIAQVGVFFVPL